MNKASPWSSDAYNLMDMTKSSEMFLMLKSAKRLHLIMDMAPPHAREPLWDSHCEGLLTEKRSDYDSPDKLDLSNRSRASRMALKKKVR